MWEALRHSLVGGDHKALARCISLVENEHPGYEDFLAALPHPNGTAIIGVTGPPGAGKSTVVDGLIAALLQEEKKVAVLCIDPSSPFNLGAVLGDRIRMSRWYLDDRVFIRSLATRGAMGGLNVKTIEITELLKAAAFDHIIVETVGVGQSEIEIAGLADTTVVVLVPEAGDEVQTMKAGLMEIAEVFVVNKSDRPDADLFVKNLLLMLAPAFQHHQKPLPVIKTVADRGEGIDKLYQAIKDSDKSDVFHQKKLWLYTEKAMQLIQKRRMKDIDRKQLSAEIKNTKDFNLYRFVQRFA